MAERRASGALLTCLIMCLYVQVPGRTEVDCRISTARTARTFYIGESPSLNIHALIPAQIVPYEVRDFDGRVVVTGEINLSESRPEILQFPRLQPGVYYLTLTFSEQDVVHDSFCVIPPPFEASGSSDLWGWQFGAMHEEYFELLAQVGARYVRFDVSWPDCEKYESSYGTGKADWFADVTKRYGLQMIPTLGYTPAWTAQKADDTTDVRTHTWMPDAVEHWADYVALLRDRLGDETVTWPSPAVFPTSPDRETLPLVRSWEIWNEVDQNFYYGPWWRYVDLMRVAHCTIKQHSQQDRIVYGGACAHWSEMGRTYSCNAQYYFDDIAWHSNGDIETELPKYYYGSPQIGFKYRLPHPTVHTECYPVTKEGVGEAAYLLRLYTSLKAFGEEGYCYSSIGGHLNGEADPNSRSLVSIAANGDFAPNAKYVAYAVTRWLLADAAYIGPVDLGEAATGHLFVRSGQLVLVGWSDTPVTATVSVDRGATRMDVMGRKWRLRGPDVLLRLSATPTTILGMAPSYVSEALTSYLDTYLSTEYGFEYHVDSPYIRPLDTDCKWWNADQGARMRATLAAAIAAMGDDPMTNARQLDALALDIRQTMMNLVTASTRENIINSIVTSSAWRLQRLAEWIARASDGLQPAAQRTLAEPDPDPSVYLEQCTGGVVDEASGTVHGFCEVLLNRGYRMAREQQRTLGHGAYLAAQTAGIVVEEYSKIDPETLRDIFVVAHFPTANIMRKGMLFRPGATHTINLQVYNFTGSAATGTINVHLPDSWSAPAASLAFSAPAMGHTDRMPLQFSIPGEPTPWVLKWTYTPASRLCVSLPSTLSSSEWPSIDGELSDGRKLLMMVYECGVGEWVPGGSP